MSNKQRLRKPLGAGADVAGAARLAADILRLAETGGKDAMIAEAQKYLGRPLVLGAAVVLLGGELAALSPGMGREDALARFERAAAQLAEPGD